MVDGNRIVELPTMWKMSVGGKIVPAEAAIYVPTARWGPRLGQDFRPDQTVAVVSVLAGAQPLEAFRAEIEGLLGTVR